MRNKIISIGFVIIIAPKLTDGMLPSVSITRGQWDKHPSARIYMRPSLSSVRRVQRAQLKLMEDGLEQRINEQVRYDDWQATNNFR